jgi:tetratricopeptide (TPR) repeat protein
MKRLVVALALVSSVAYADKADALFTKGKKLLAEKRYAEACKAFEDSDQLDPGIGAKLNVARCYKEWGKLATAYRWFRDAEDMARKTKDERAAKIHALVEEVDADVPRLTIKAPPGADATGVAIKLDAQPFPADQLGIEHRVDPGPHLVEYVVNATTLTKTVPIEPGGASEVTLELPTAQKPRAPRARAVAEGAPPGRTQRIVGVGLGVAGLAAAGVAGIVTLKARSDYKDALGAHCRGATDMCDADGLAATHDARHRANIATAITIAGGAAIAGGVVLYLLAPRAARDEHALYLAPQLDGGTSVVLGGRF